MTALDDRPTVRVAPSGPPGPAVRAAVLLGAVGVLAAAVLLSLAVGSRALPAADVLRALVRDDGGETDRGYWVYDYAAMGRVVDHIRIMAYDYSTGSDPGPMAPLAYVREVIAAAKQAVDPDGILNPGVLLDPNPG